MIRLQGLAVVMDALWAAHLLASHGRTNTSISTGSATTPCRAEATGPVRLPVGAGTELAATAAAATDPSTAPARPGDHDG